MVESFGSDSSVSIHPTVSRASKGISVSVLNTGVGVIVDLSVGEVGIIVEAFEAVGLDRNTVDLVIPHQANQRITDAVRMKLELKEEQVYSNIHKYGNTTAASIPIAMSEAIDEGRIWDGSLVCLAAFGSGFTWASALIRF